MNWKGVFEGPQRNRIGSVNFACSLLASLASIVRDVSEDKKRLVKPSSLTWPV